jgi:5-methylcytosine-specific restriction endonuclease McrA
MADQGRIVSAHETVEHIEVTINELPGNVPKDETPKFHKNAQHLLNDLKLGCWLCQFQRHPQGTGPLEVHHMIEWAEWSDVDPAIATKLLGCFNLHKYSGQPVTDPDDLPNLVVLHESCHRGVPGQQVMAGAHYAPFPIWFAQGAAKDGVQIAGDVNHLLDRTGTSGKKQQPLDTDQQVGGEEIQQFTVVVDDPAHPQRKESERFAQSRARLIKEVGRCWLCQFQAHQRGEGPLEAHHLVEWSEWNDADPERVTKLCGLIKANPYSGQPVTSPDDIPNLVLLHETCHIGKNAEHAMSGIHYIPFAIWLAQGAAKSGVTIVADHQHLLGKLGGLHLFRKAPAPPPPAAPPAEHAAHKLSEHRRGFVLFGMHFGR